MVSSLLFFFFGFAYSYFFYKDSQRTYELTVGDDGFFEKGKIQYFYIWNSGKNTIYKEDLLNESKCLEISFEDGYPVEYIKISDKTSNYFKVDLVKKYTNIKIDFDLLRPDEGFTLMIKAERLSSSLWDFPIKQKQKILTFPRHIKARGLESNFTLFNNLLGYVGMSSVLISAIYLEKIDFRNLDAWYDYFYAGMNLLVLGILIYGIPTLLRRVRAPRPPIELELHFIKRNKEREKNSSTLKFLSSRKFKKR